MIRKSLLKAAFANGKHKVQYEIRTYYHFLQVRPTFSIKIILYNVLDEVAFQWMYFHEKKFRFFSSDIEGYWKHYKHISWIHSKKLAWRCGHEGHKIRTKAITGANFETDYERTTTPWGSKWQSLTRIWLQAKQEEIKCQPFSFWAKYKFFSRYAF